MGKTQPPKKPNELDLTGLNGDIKYPVIFPDSHFGLESGVWDAAQRIADMLPIQIQVYGDLNEEAVLDLTEKAKGAEIQQKYWTEYSAAVSRFLKAFYKVKEKQAEVAENTAEARVKHAELEKDLGTALASFESQYRQIVGSYRSAIASTAGDLEISLNKIASQYSQARAKKAEAVQGDAKKNETPYAKQTESLVDKFRKAREARYNGPSAGITRRISGT
jgi:hypothetical protein